jgi:hypothetical protein
MVSPILDATIGIAYRNIKEISTTELALGARSSTAGFRRRSADDQAALRKAIAEALG